MGSIHPTNLLGPYVNVSLLLHRNLHPVNCMRVGVHDKRTYINNNLLCFKNGFRTDYKNLLSISTHILHFHFMKCMKNASQKKKMMIFLVFTETPWTRN